MNTADTNWDKLYSEFKARQDKSLLKSLSSDAAELLLVYMSNISEDHYCAGWLIGLEYELWDIMNGAARNFGFGPISAQDMAKLRGLHERAGGWWVWDGEGAGSGEIFVTTEEWLNILANKITKEKP